MSIAAKQATSIYKSGIEFSKEPISTGSKLVFLPENKNKYNDMIKNYEMKREHQELMMKQNRDRLIDHDPSYMLKQRPNEKHSVSKSETSACSSGRDMKSSVTTSSIKSEPIQYWQTDPFKKNKYGNYSNRPPKNFNESNEINSLGQYHDFQDKKRTGNVKPTDKPPVYGNYSNRPLSEMDQGTFWKKHPSARGNFIFCLKNRQGAGPKIDPMGQRK